MDYHYDPGQLTTSMDTNTLNEMEPEPSTPNRNDNMDNDGFDAMVMDTMDNDNWQTGMETMDSLNGWTDGKGGGGMVDGRVAWKGDALEGAEMEVGGREVGDRGGGGEKNFW